MGKIYKANDTRLDRVVAIKVSKTEFSERFEREAKAIATLNHTHIRLGTQRRDADYQTTDRWHRDGT